MYIHISMLKKTPVLFILLVFIANMSLKAQTKQTMIADMLLSEGRFQTALQLYREAENEERKKDYIFLKMATCFNNLFLGDSALKYIDLAMSKVKYPTVEMYRTKGKSLQLVYKFDDAIKHYNKADPRRMDKVWIPKYLRECENAKKYFKRPVKVKIDNVGEVVNTRHHDLLPKITADGKYLYFASYPPASEVKRNNLQDIYRSVWEENKWAKPEQVKSPISDLENNDAVVGLSPDGQTMFIFRGSNGGDILMSRFKGGEWQRPESLPFNTIHKESSITISPDGKTLLFVRKSKGGNGNIYKCTLQEDGSWSTPKLLSKVVNSPFDEESPFLHPDGKTLYFSSKGHSTMGGYDIFKTTLVEGKWTTPVNIGYPVNTTGDDFCFVLSADGKKGFYSSQRPGGYGGQDIYELTFPVLKKLPELTLMQGFITEKLSGKPVEAVISIWDNDKKQQVAEFRSKANTGEYLVSLPAGKNYGIIIEEERYLFHSENVFLPLGDGYKSIKKDIELVAIKKGEKIRLNNVFFETGLSSLSPASHNELDLIVDLLQNNTSLKVEIGGHTDNVGEASANISLSQKRADVVVNYILLKGIDKSRLVAKGYGSLEPVGDNREEIGRQLNRRTELKIVD